MKVFITGIAGFIGFHLARRLKAEGFDVHGCDNFNPYYSPALKKARSQILEKEGIKITHCDIQDLKPEPYDYFIHLAAQAGVRYSLENPSTYIQTNINGFFHILEICRKQPSMKLIYASSSSVYGINRKIPFAETDKTDSPASLYGATKKAGELMAHSYHHLFQIPIVGLRFFTVYGPWGRPDMAYYSFTESILQNKPIKLFNFGKVERDFTYIDDIIQGIRKAMEIDGKAQVFNLGNSKKVPVSHMITTLEDLLGKKANIELSPPAKGDVVETFADLSLSSEVLGFQPTTSIEQGLEKFTSWYLTHHIS